jgi:hypothetical protein
MTFQEELRVLLRKHHLQWDERYRILTQRRKVFKKSNCSAVLTLLGVLASWREKLLSVTPPFANH